MFCVVYRVIDRLMTIAVTIAKQLIVLIVIIIIIIDYSTLVDS